ncbi:MAG: hypothetical protein JNL62_04485 [Bryobacterales bacterium]|nr:hypothetical protein [Bryobacterales bacterium]
MSRSFLFGLSVLAFSGIVSAQTVSTTTISTSPQGLRIFVDGVPYQGTQTFLWPAGSKHTISAETAQYWFPGRRSTFNGWTESSNKLTLSGDTLTITADPAITFYRANYTDEYLIRFNFYSCNHAFPESCRPPWTISVGGTFVSQDHELWTALDAVLVLVAQPNPGFVFAGWGPAGGNSTSAILEYTVKGTATFSALFAAAKRVTLLSDPPELLVAPDRTPTRTPAEVDWGQGTRHVLGAVSPQAEKENGSRIWVFKDWSNGAKLNDLYVVSNTSTPETLTARFVRGAGASFVTTPTNLKLKIDGKDSWVAYNFTWGVGMSYEVSAPLEQTDSRGRRYRFKSWSNGGPATQTVTITDEHVTTGFRMIATYEPLSRLTLTTNPPGMALTVDGKECRGSCTLDKVEGEQVVIKASSALTTSDTSRLQFEGWSDGGAADRTFTFGSEANVNLVATYRSYFRLVATADPGTGAVFQVEPSSPDGFYASDTNVIVTAETKPGYRFRRWDGDLTGTYRMGSVQMTVPRVVRALLDITPYAEEAGVRNAAGETPEPLVAPGSIGTIYGANLAGSYEVGPSNPLAQTIGSVVVRMGSRYLPLVFVSPEQINLQVPSDLAEGVYNVAVKWSTYPEVQSTMRVVRNAPGLFSRKVNDQTLAAAIRENGDEIKPEQPAERGETITLFGTGFGPYARPVLDGFPLPADPPNPLADTVEVILADRVLEALWAGGAPNQVGTAMVRFRLPEDAPVQDGGVPVRVRINGRESNSVFLLIR